MSRAADSSQCIRKAVAEDTPMLCKLMFQLSEEAISYDDMQDRLRMTEQSLSDTIYIYEQEGCVLGTLVFRVRENIREVSRYGEICIIVVDAAAKRSGIGRALMLFAEQMAIDLGCKGTYLISGFGRKEEAHLFYQELGYEITGYRFVKRLEKCE
ncbi:GNAT family N-acetyltransferase [Paenibacillus sp. LMG 31456]|uniref:GNAT family N-acetyltransferase n=1 Tax=Paenibacillus foliorum TaxID=2654974 RepID=A0A972K2I9_9BACL|nr:GNAT family N-acetyltransferase [Paenibacillus foliorum]NOU95950.1 GNAT family N-acetyltransferase [Paenibacillus foliorum]